MFCFENMFISQKTTKIFIEKSPQKTWKNDVFSVISKNWSWIERAQSRARTRECYESKEWLILNIFSFESMLISLKTKNLFTIVTPPRKPRFRGESGTLKRDNFGYVSKRLSYLSFWKFHECKLWIITHIWTSYLIPKA